MADTRARARRRFVCVTFPCLCVLRMHREVLSARERALNITLVGFAVVVSGTATLEVVGRILARAAADLAGEGVPP